MSVQMGECKAMQNKEIVLKSLKIGQPATLTAHVSFCGKTQKNRCSCCDILAVILELQLSHLPLAGGAICELL